MNFPRFSVKDHIFCGVPVFKGTGIQFFSLSTHYDPKIYPDPFEFKPERWLDKKDLDHFNLVGFSTSPRMCLGQVLAHIETKIAFYCFYKRYEKVEVPETIKFRYRSMISA